MLFVELRFVLFFAFVFGVHWTLRRDGWRKGWLLLASYAFYAAWDWRFLSLILVSTLIDYTAGRHMETLPSSGEDGSRPRRPWLILSLLANLGLLGFFKYYNFFVASAVEFTTLLGLPLTAPTLQIVLPVGISFYTFQTLSYTVDVYRGQVAPVRSLRDFALFVAFFPQLVAGPILRASHFLPQLSKPRRWAGVDVRGCLVLFMVGYVKKALMADHAARIVEPIFNNPGAFGPLDKWLGAALYALQIYGDFSGYSDMAIATGGLLGYWVPRNFAHPYVADSIRAFWRRWHISLSTWFRDYLYIPLGGNRASPARLQLNLIIVFLLCGLWHGANWTFVVWGAFHGIFLSLEHLGYVERLPRVLRHAYVLVVVLVGWVFFRASDLPTAGSYIAGMFGASGEGSVAPWSGAFDPAWWLLLPAFGVVHALMDRKEARDRLSGGNPWIWAFAYGVAVALVLPWAATRYEPFIYFQF